MLPLPLNETSVENNSLTILSFSEELLLESQKLSSQLENVMHDTMKDQEQSFMVTYLIFFYKWIGDAYYFKLLLVYLCLQISNRVSGNLFSLVNKKRI